MEMVRDVFRTTQFVAGPDAAEIIARTLSSRAIQIPEEYAQRVPAQLRVVIERCLEQEPANRLKSIENVRGELLNALQSPGEPT